MRNLRRISEKYEFSLDGKQISLIFFLIVLLIGLSFSIGVMYGKGLKKIEKPEIIGKEEKPLEPILPPDNVVQVQPPKIIEGQQSEVNKEDYTFYKTLTEKTSPPGIEGEGEKPKEVTIPPPEITDKPVQEKIQKKEEIKQKEELTGEYAIQVVAYNDREKARAMVKRLKSEGFNAFVEEGKSGNKRIFRVKIGYYRTREAAEKVLKELKKENLAGFITK